MVAAGSRPAAFRLRNRLHVFLQPAPGLSFVSCEPFFHVLPLSITHGSERIPHFKEILMPDIRPINVARAAIAPAFSKQFTLRFAISLLLTGVDADVVLISARSVFTAIFIAPILRAALVILILGLLVSLVRMWFLISRDRP
jgi:hypothetical protein